MGRIEVAIGVLCMFVVAALGGCAKDEKPESKRTRHDKERVLRHPVPDGPPPADVVRKLEFSRYEEINAAGGLRLTLTATGKSKVVHPKLYQVEVKECRPEPQAHPGDYECTLRIQLSLADDGKDPSWQGERISVSWDGEEGVWQTP